MENSSKPENPHQHQHHHQPLNLKTIKDLYLSANLHNPLNKPNSKNSSSSPPSLHWITNLYYLPGYGYLTGTILGTAKGTIQALKATSLKDSFKIQRNLVLNCGIEGGKRCGSALGMVGLIYAVWEFGVVYFVTRNPNPYDVVNTVVAGYGTGWTYKMFSGKKVANLAGVVGAVVAVSGKAILKKKKNAFLCHLQYES